MTFPEKMSGEKQALSEVEGRSGYAQFALPPPVDQTGYRPAFTMLLVNVKFDIFGATGPPALIRVRFGKAVT